MALSIKDEKADRLARELARRTGETLTEAVTRALEERLRRVPQRGSKRRLADELDALALRIAALAGDDPRTPEEIIGYDEHGLPR
jgi:antitoxin VapB